MTVTSTSYSNTLFKLQMVMKKRRRLLSRGVILHHNNVSSHNASLTQTRIKNMKWEILMHSLYSPNLTPSDFHTSSSPKSDLGGKHFKMGELNSPVKAFFQKQETEWYCRGIQNWAKRHNKNHNLGGNDVEK